MEKRNNLSTLIAMQATAILGLDNHSSYQALFALQGPSPNTYQMDNLKNGAPNFETDFKKKSLDNLASSQHSIVSNSVPIVGIVVWNSCL